MSVNRPIRVHSGHFGHSHRVRLLGQGLERLGYPYLRYRKLLEGNLRSRKLLTGNLGTHG
jgi:hypothetical protein